MAQRIFQSFRRLPTQFTSMRKKQDTIEVCSNIGFPSKPSSLAYDQTLDVFALATRDGLLYVFGKPGVVYYGSHKDASEIIEVVFITGTGKLLTLSDSDDVFVWEIDPSASPQPCLQNIGRLHKVSVSLEPKRLGPDPLDYIESHVTALIVGSSNSSIIIGTDQGSVAIIKRNTSVKQGVAQDEGSMWIFPKQKDVLTAHHIMQSLSINAIPSGSIDSQKTIDLKVTRLRRPTTSLFIKVEPSNMIIGNWCEYRGIVGPIITKVPSNRLVMTAAYSQSVMISEVNNANGAVYSKRTKRAQIFLFVGPLRGAVIQLFIEPNSIMLLTQREAYVID
ncbi:hypothetical protein ACTXT7_013187 [Hymenolepis weldensis]